jgi:hypothetical protein
VLAVGLACRGGGIVHAFIVCSVFSATAALTIPALGGAPITPVMMMLPFLILRASAERGIQNIVAQLVPPSAGFWLFALVGWGVLTAVASPRYFAGDTMVFTTIRSGAAGLSVQFLPLGPNSTNLTQTAYAIAGFFAFVSLRTLMSEAGRLAKFADAVLLVGALNCGLALLDLVERRLGMPGLVALLRNANYAIATDTEVAGLARVTGTFAEASAFSAYTLPILVFATSLWQMGVRRIYSGSIALLSLSLLLVSTSSTAYVALLALVFGYTAIAVVRPFLTFQRATLGPLAVLAWFASVATCMMLLLRPGFFDKLRYYSDLFLVQKLQSSSGLERAMWNTQAWANLIDSYGVGVGLGSARASSFVLVLLSNLGVIGIVLFAAFLCRVLLDSSGTQHAAESQVARASALALMSALLAASISGTVFDLGMPFYAFAAAASAGLGTSPARRLRVANR